MVEFIANKPKGGKTGDEGDDATSKKIAKIKAAMEKLPESDSEDEEPPAKKAKKSEGNELEMMARAMKVYSKMKNDDLKNVLRWNLGYGMTGKKNELLLRYVLYPMLDWSSMLYCMTSWCT